MELFRPMEPTSWTVGKQTVVLGSCLIVLQRVQVASIDVIITSPPYNIGTSYESYHDNQPRETYFSWLKKVSKQLVRVLKPNGSFFLNVGSTNTKPWTAMDAANAFRDDFVLQNNITWVKSISIRDASFGHFKPINSRRFLNQNHESILHFTRGGNVQLDRLSIGVPFKDKSNIARRGHMADKRCAGNVWYIPYKTVRSRAEKLDHPASFPVELPTRCMMLHEKSDMIVLDPFVGAGTTLIAAQRLGHRGIGIEVDPQYIATSISRLEADVSNAGRRSKSCGGRLSYGVKAVRQRLPEQQP